MSGVKDILKNGWHPEKEGTTIKDQMKTLIGRGDDNNHRHSGRVPVPISSLKDPSTFAPPPKRNPNTTIAPPTPPPRPSSTTSPSPLKVASNAQHDGPQSPQQWRLDTTGLSTTNMPPPPTRRSGPGSHLPSPSPPPPSTKPGPPALPPRLPPRSTSSSPPLPARPVEPTSSDSTSLLNQTATRRLASSGISVPALGIGSAASSSPPLPTRSPTSSSPAPTSQLNELQSRFGRLKSPSSPSSSQHPSEGTTLQQKQAALKTAAAFRKDPTSVSFSDARQAASTINNFRQRHGEQVAAGLNGANVAYERYGGANTGRQGGEGEGDTTPTAMSFLVKKKPPPPPPKKPGLRHQAQTLEAEDVRQQLPPPIPLGTRPQI